MAKCRTNFNLLKVLAFFIGDAFLTSIATVLPHAQMPKGQLTIRHIRSPVIGSLSMTQFQRKIRFE